MSKPVELQRITINKKTYQLPPEEAEIEKLIQKGKSLMAKNQEVANELETVKKRLVELATARRKKTTIITLKGITGRAIITFREEYICGNDIIKIKPQIGDLFGRFFRKETKESFKATKDLKNFIEDRIDLPGISGIAELKELLLSKLTLKSIKPNLKFEFEE